MISYIMINHQAYNFNKLLKNVEELTKSEVRSSSLRSGTIVQKLLKET